MKQRLHIVYFISVTSAGVLTGTALALNPKTTYFAALPWLLLAAILFILVAIWRYKWMLTVALICGILLGLWRGANAQIAFSQYGQYYGQTVILTGRVASDVTEKNNGTTGVNLSKIKINNMPMSGNVWVSLSTRDQIKRGDNLQIEGEIRNGFGNFPATISRAKLLKVENIKHGDIGREIRDWFSRKVLMIIPKEQAGLGLSYLVGQQQLLSEDFSNELKMLGLIHLVVASGYHLSLIVSYIKRPLSKVSKYLALIASLFFIGAFLSISGFGTSMIRASIMTVLSLLAWYYGRKINPVVLIVFVAAMTVLLSPAYVWGDVGWYLSFAAFGGVIILAPLIHNYFWGEKEPGFLRHLLIGTISAQILTLPIIAFTFGEYSPLALILNILIQPFVPLAMLLTFIGGIVAAIFPPLAHFAGWPANALLTYMIRVADWLAGLPWAEGELKFNASYLILSCVVILSLNVFLWKKTKLGFKRENVLD